jgi:RNA polymerase sigma-70 factor (ECF subfamily)
MDDEKILGLFLARDEKAIAEVRQKYAAYCGAVASRILRDSSDAEEALSDTWLAAWRSIPPHEPKCLRTYLSRLTRNISVNMLERSSAQKRGSGVAHIVLDEVADWLVSDKDDVEDSVNERLLTEALNAFLTELSDTERRVFVRRYTFFQPVSEIARAHGFTENKVKSMLMRLRKRLRAKLEKEELI